MDGVAIYSCGDGIHDPDQMEVHMASSPDGPWERISHFSVRYSLVDTAT